MSIRARPAAPASQPPVRPDDKEFMATLAKGLAVLGAFGKDRPTLTLSEAAAATGISRATARRILRTLAELGYVEQSGRQFALTANILRLGFAYLGSQSWIDRTLPLLRELGERSQESCSAALLEGSEIVYVARVPARRIMSMALSVGSRLTAFHTALGRIQLGFLDEDELWRRLKSLRLAPFTPYTITDLQAIIDRIRDDHAQGFSIVDEELELGLRALAVPVLDRRHELVAAINMSTHASRTTRNEMRAHFLPELQRVAAQIALLLP